MIGPDEIHGADELDPTEERLRASRRLPAESYRDGLRRRLLRHGIAPPQIRRLVAVYAATGALLLVVAGLGLAGAGPLAT
jgi:hypothetical protein